MKEAGPDLLAAAELETGCSQSGSQGKPTWLDQGRGKSGEISKYIQEKEVFAKL